MSEIPLPTSWSLPKIAAALDFTVPYSKFNTATRFFCAKQGLASTRRIKTKRRNLSMGALLLLGFRSGSIHDYSRSQPSDIFEWQNPIPNKIRWQLFRQPASPPQPRAALPRSFSRPSKFALRTFPLFDPQILKLFGVPLTSSAVPYTVHRALYRASR